MNRYVEKAHYDTDLKASQAMQYLYKNNTDENVLTRILSVGSLGIGKNRKLVPTRWSITAVDDSLGKNIITEIKNCQTTNIKVHFGGFMGNYFLILMLPEVWSYELFEMYAPDNFLNKSSDIKYTTDHEFYDGRSTYASNTAGGYYAARLPILEELFVQGLARAIGRFFLECPLKDGTLIGDLCKKAGRWRFLNKEELKMPLKSPAQNKER